MTLPYWHLPQVPAVQPVGRCWSSFLPCVFSLVLERANVVNVFFICNLWNTYSLLHCLVWARNVCTEYRTGEKMVCEGEECFWVSIQPFMFAKVTSLLPVINSEPGASATVPVWRDGGKRKCLSHQLFLDWNTEVSKVRLQGRAAGNGDGAPGCSSPGDRICGRGWKCGLTLRCCSVAAFDSSPTAFLLGTLLTELQPLGSCL